MPTHHSTATCAAHLKLLCSVSSSQSSYSCPQISKGQLYPYKGSGQSLILDDDFHIQTARESYILSTSPASTATCFISTRITAPRSSWLASYLKKSLHRVSSHHGNQSDYSLIQARPILCTRLSKSFCLGQSMRLPRRRVSRTSLTSRPTTLPSCLHCSQTSLPAAPQHNWMSLHIPDPLQRNPAFRDAHGSSHHHPLQGFPQLSFLRSSPVTLHLYAYIYLKSREEENGLSHLLVQAPNVQNNLADVTG